jgi:hypothetical protein
MKHKKTITCAAFLLLGLSAVQAQESPTTTGGEATGTGGSASYSVGQVVYTTATGTNGSVAQGVQQAYEISISTGVNETSIHLELAVYPNPTKDFLNLTVKSEELESLSYQLYSLEGKVIEDKKVNENSTTIKMEELPNSIYFLKVTNNNQIVKTFKIIKN